MHSVYHMVKLFWFLKAGSVSKVWSFLFLVKSGEAWGRALFPAVSQEA